MRPLARSLLSALLAAFLVGLVALPALADPPAASDDAYSTPEDQQLVVPATGVLGNDTDTDGTIEVGLPVITDVAHGTLDPLSDGSFTYTPEQDFHGSDSFQYQAFDGPDGSNVATVTLTVDPVNDPPIAIDDDFGATPEDTPVTADVLGNDHDDADGDTLSVLSVGDPGHGTTTDNGDGTITYDPAQDFHGADSFSYTVSDGHGGTDDGSVSVGVTSVNDPPVANDDPLYAVTHDHTLTVLAATGVLANDTDADSDGLTASLSGDEPTHGTLTRHSNGSFEYEPDTGFVGTDTFTYTAFDGTVQSDPATATITVADQVPVSTADAYPGEGDPSFLEDTTLEVDDPGAGVLGNDGDADGDGMTAAVATGPAHGDVTLQPDGSFSYTPDGNFEGQDSFTYIATDSVGGAGSPAAVTVDVTGTEDDPTAVDDSATTAEDHAVTIDVLGNDSDPDLGDTLAVDLSASAASDGSVSANEDGTVTYTPSQDFNGSDSFTYKADDGHGGTSTATVHVTVTAVNDAPTGIADSYEVTSLPFTGSSVLSNDVDVDGPVKRATIVTQATLGVVTLNKFNGTFTYAPNPGVCQRTDGFTYRVSDTLAAPSAPVSVTLNVALPKTDVALTVTRSAITVGYQGSVTVTAHVSAFTPGAKLTITRTPIGGAPIPLVTHAPDGSGNVKFTAPGLQVRNVFTAASKFDNCHNPATSSPAPVLVRAKVTSTLTNFFKIKDGYRLYHVPVDGQASTFPLLKGAIAPLKAGTATIEWQRRSGSKWMAYGLFDNWPLVNGKVSALLTSGAVEGFDYRIRVTWPGDAANVKSASDWVYFRVVP